MARKAEALQLTDEQVAQVVALKEQHKEEWQANREERKAAFENILTEEQLAILSAHRENREEGTRSKGTRPDLGLSEDQQAALTELHTTTQGSGAGGTRRLPRRVRSHPDPRTAGHP